MILAVTALATIGFGLLIVLLYPGADRGVLLYYFAPIGFPFVAHLFDRARRWRAFGLVSLTVEILTIALALARAIVPVPLISGHALFLTYSMLTTRTLVARLSAALVMAEVVYLKVFVWQDRRTLVGGILVGLAAAAVFRKSLGHEDTSLCAAVEV